MLTRPSLSSCKAQCAHRDSLYLSTASAHAAVKETPKLSKPPKAKGAGQALSNAEQREATIRQPSKKPCPGTKEEMDAIFDHLFKTYDDFKKGVDSVFEEDWMKENRCDNIFIGAVDVRLNPEEASTLDEAQREELNNLILEFKDIFETEGPPTTLTEHCIDTGESPPISVPPYRLSPGKREMLKREIAEMLQLGIIEECDSPWTSNVVLVPKKGGGIRVCIDYRQVNKVTVPDPYPLPRIDNLLHSSRGFDCMTSMDLRTGFWLIPVRKQDRPKTAFVTPFSVFQFKVMPFGLRNPGATFQRLVDRLKN